MDKRYQVFVSSTYVDLKEERAKVLQTLMGMNCIPAGMELFPAADEDQFEFIKKVIDDCDYYLLIIGGRYGTTDADGVSYTEKEYDYAVERNIKVIAIIHCEPEQLPAKKYENDPDLRAKLVSFKEKVSKGRIVKYWNTASELSGIVALSLIDTIKRFPATGWVRADKIANEKVLEELNELRKENRALHDRLSSENISTALKEMNESIALTGNILTTTKKGEGASKRLGSWKYAYLMKNIFGTLSALLNGYIYETEAYSLLLKMMKEHINKAEIDLKGTLPNNFSYDIHHESFEKIKHQLLKTRLLALERDEAPRAMHVKWSLTPKGRDLMLKIVEEDT